jgi:hypothetical protein
MVGHGKSVSHGVNLICYISGEAANKKHPEDIHHVEDRFIPSGLDAQGIYDMMRQRCKLKNNVIRIEISPAKQYTENFTMDDWRDLWHDFMQEFDKQVLKDTKSGDIYSYKTNISGSRSTCWLHFESEGKIPHLHAAVCRYDEDGKTNNDHGIHLRAQQAAEAVARKRGWQTAWEKHAINIKQVNDDCMEVLHAMPRWSWSDYVARLQARGYKVNAKPDSKGQLHGYSIQKGNSKYKASELGKGRNLMYSKLESIWNKLHPVSRDEVAKPLVTPSSQTSHNPKSPVVNLLEKYSNWGWNTTRHEITVDGVKHTVHLPKELENVLQEEVDYREYRDWDDIQNLALIFFFGSLAANSAAASSGGGGGGGNDRGWRDKDDEDELARMRRCSRTAIAHYGGRKKSKGRST